MGKETKHFYEFGPFRVDPSQRLLLRDGRPVPLQPKAFETLLVLVQNSEKPLLKDELMKALWPDSFVEESNLAQNIFVLRKALGDTGGESRYIVTLPGKGYRFVQNVRILAEGERASQTQVTTEENPPPSILGMGWRDRRTRAPMLVLGMVILLAAGYLAWRPSRRPAQPTPRRIMLAVLPFQNLTGDVEQEYFADGLTEELITRLGRLHPVQLGIIARTSVMTYKHSDKRLDQIGRELGVQYVLEGSVRRAGDRVRITAQLISVVDQSHLWADDYDRKLEDVVTVQDDVAIAVANETRLKLDPSQQGDLAPSRTVNPEAYEAYLKGRFFWNKRTESGLRKSVDYFESAIAKDPAFAQAYAGLADSYVLLGGYGFDVQKITVPKAKAAALQALAIDDHLAEPYTSLALVAQQYDWNWKDAEKDYKSAIELNPNYSVAHHWYGDGYLAAVGRMDEAIAELRQAQELDPLSLVISTDLAKRLCFVGQYDEGMERFRRILEIDPDFVLAHYFLSQVYEQRGLYAEAIAEIGKIRSADTTGIVGAQLGHIYAVQGRRKEALQLVDELQRRSNQTYIDPSRLAYIYIALGEKDAAFTWLEKAYQQHSPAMNGLKTDLVYAPLRSDPRFTGLMRRVGLTP
jgi:TolB-like protein/DNA-binding winged helix-turn-helix (wHTH) protein/Tfp pilus assembly protein PilF